MTDPEVIRIPYPFHHFSGYTYEKQNHQTLINFQRFLNSHSEFYPLPCQHFLNTYKFLHLVLKYLVIF